MTSPAFDSVTHAFLEPFMEKYDAAWKAERGDAVAALCVDDVSWSDPALPAPLHGRQEVADFVDSFHKAFPDAQFEGRDPALSADGRSALVPYRLRATNTGPIEPAGFAATGKELDVDGVDWFAFRGGLIARYRTYMDVADVMRQLGVLPARGSRPERFLSSIQRLTARLRSTK